MVVTVYSLALVIYCSLKHQLLELITVGLLNNYLALPILRLLLPKAQERKDFKKTSKPCHVVIHRIALSQRILR